MKYRQIKSNATTSRNKNKFVFKGKKQILKTSLSKLGCYGNFNVEVQFSNLLIIHKENTKGINVFKQVFGNQMESC